MEVVDTTSFGLLLVDQGHDPVELDIVAVHGLDGHREKSWSKGDINWLREFLPQDMPHARILSYGYDAFTRSSGKIACLSLYRLGQNLAADLAAERARSAVPRQRPIIFVAHSLGGLVLKEALVDAFLRPIDSHIRGIELSTSGIIFLGTPHRGSPYSGHLQFITNVLSLVAYTNNVALKDLEPNATPSAKALEQYDNIREHSKYDQVCFYESHATSVGRFAKRIVSWLARASADFFTLIKSQLVPESSAVINGATKRALYKDHLGLVKFDSNTDGAYVAIRDEITEMAKDAPSKIQERCFLGKRTKPPLSLFDIPPFQVPNFVHRPKLMEDIEYSFSGAMSDRPSGSVTVAMVGMGGQGKTQLGIEYCQRVKKEGQAKAIFWIDATSRASVIRGMENIANRLFPARDSEKEEDKVSAAREGLRDLTDPWLLVFDGYDLLHDFSDLHVFFPQSPLGSILVTSRHRGTGMLGTVVEVGRMNTAEGLSLLLGPREAVLSNDEREVAYQILPLLGNLPLAIDQARAYISIRGLPLARFLSEFSSRKEHILRETPQLSVYRRKLPDADKETVHSVFTTLELSLSQLRSSSALASVLEDVLTLLAFYHPNNIVEDIFLAAVEEESPINSFFDQNGWNHLTFESAMTQMQSLSLLQFVHTPAHQILLSLHPLVSDWLRLRICPSDVPRYLHLARLHFNAHLDTNDVELMAFPQRQQTLVQLDCLCNPELRDSGEPNENRFYYTSGLFYVSCGQFELGEETLKRALAGYNKTLGPDHASTLDAVDHLGLLYRDRGRLQEAEDMYKRALAGWERGLGSEHSSTLRTVDNLGVLYKDQGLLREAENMYKRALAGREKVLGPDHASTLETVDHLGILYRDQGRLEETEKMYMRALAGKENLLGPDHTLTLKTMNNLAILYWNLGRLKEAEKMCKRTLMRKENVLGPDHTSTLSTLHNLALLYNDQGRLEEAEDTYKRTLEGWEKALGPDHSLTLGTVDNLGVLYREQGRLDEAEAMQSRALAGFMKTLGPEHITTLDSMDNFGVLNRVQGRLDEAEDIHTRALAGFEKALGLDHNLTLLVVDNLGVLYTDQRRLDKAEEMHTRALEGFVRALGLDHIRTLDSTDNLGVLYRVQGRLREAEEMHMRALSGREKTLGLDHTSTLSSVCNLGKVLHKLGRLKEAGEMFKRALAGFEKLLAPHHPSTLEAAKCLNNLCCDLERLDDAEPMFEMLGPGQNSGSDSDSGLSNEEYHDCLEE